MNLLHRPVRMHIASVGVSKFCFLFSLAFCGLLLLLLPALQPPARQVDLPQPRPQIRPTPSHHTRVPAVSVHAGETDLSTGLNGSSVGQGGSTETEATRNDKTEVGSKRNQERGAPPGGKIGGGLSGSKSHDPLELKDIFIAVKTTRKYHKSRLELLIQTWVSQAKEQTYMFTDGEDKELRMRTGANIINTNCSAAHTRQALCCKMSVEYDKFIESQKKWFCHVDDDNYVILPSLLQMLSSYHHSQDVYLGRPSLDHPIEAAERVKSDGSVSVKFWFATGGAGFCISRGLALKMSPWASLGNFISTAEKIRLPDDCTIGYIIEALLEVTLTHTHLFHSHLENLQKLPTDSVLEQVTLSYGGFENRRNVVSIVGGFSLAEDPTRFKTVHCLLYPDTDWCPRRKPRHKN
ncbi:beta-1,3-N-acetylglucosaminyltransferase radical fringe [Seriola lalandi dorsalis]|uniref:Beta-1,3-N-acetylglucosaminyltransferase n=1 Tax=Seriola lalandi dorsalis TaxID=1841481 RepID=A0A3B4XWJ3_SERLL|nr:beta-1,3-N-acetylglucosaminyltransferase radical fringe [Seriola lalandi dorsalis]XP_056222390.1 beta-1,3-N-acetylglucosaminyltransferase radical fringe [Seriola aureovittata]XP_056222391.1 beta-1,3-N-acetylglucosaminyltransferase radical fringe [Seriola aureovittata]